MGRNKLVLAFIFAAVTDAEFERALSRAGGTFTLKTDTLFLGSPTVHIIQEVLPNSIKPIKM